jgi:trehalose utilization protein
MSAHLAAGDGLHPATAITKIDCVLRSADLRREVQLNENFSKGTYSMATHNDAPIKVLVWDENPSHADKKLYPNSLRTTIADALNALGGGQIEAAVANIDEHAQGITAEILANADVLLWWGHGRHAEVLDETAELVRKAVHENGLGFIPLHSGHYSKPFKVVLNATGHLKGGWREVEDFEPEEITVCAPRHPIAAGIENFTIENEEMYGSPFDAPPYETLVFQSYFPHGGEYFPCGFTLSVGRGIDAEFTSGPGKGANQGEGAGRVFYFRPGHETVPTYHHPVVQQILRNAVLWCARRS